MPGWLSTLDSRLLTLIRLSTALPRRFWPTDACVLTNITIHFLEKLFALGPGVLIAVSY